MKGVVTLLTDFGDSFYPAVMKGVILSTCSDLQLIDITHNSPAFDIGAAAFSLYRTIAAFQLSAVHLVVVDPGVGTQRRAIAISIGNNSFLIGPDNGVLSWVLPDTGYEARVLDVPDTASLTFHGRDVFAPAAARLACDPDSFSGLGRVIEPRRLPMPGFEVRDGGIHAGVMFIDSFGNIIVPVHKKDRLFDTKKALQVIMDKGFYEFHYGTYGKIGPGGLCWHYDSSGYLELSVGEGDLARLTGLDRQARLLLKQ